MLKKHIRSICLSLVTTGAIFFVGNVQSAESGIVWQPQIDGPTTAGSTIIGSAAMAVGEPANASAQLSTSGARAITEKPTSESNQRVERDFFRDAEGAHK